MTKHFWFRLEVQFKVKYATSFILPHNLQGAKLAGALSNPTLQLQGHDRDIYHSV
jgi:hypothetical protein